MLLLQANDIVKDYADRRVLDIAEFKIYDGDRIGLVGENGAGKSTLMNILSGECTPDSGSVKRACRAARVAQFGEGEDIAPDASAGELISRFNAQEAHSGLSGGECTRRRIAAALAQNPKILMLDEPTTDLDAQGIAELMRELRDFDGALLLISHDRALLDALCTSIAELEDSHITIYPGSYSDYAAEKLRRREFQAFEFNQYRAERARLTAAIADKERHASSVSKLPKRMGNSEARLHRRSATEVEEKLHKTASALRSRLSQLEEKERPRDLPKISMRLGAAGGITSKRALDVRRLKLQVPGRVLLKDVNFTLPTGTRTALLGPNGCGKTTLISRLIEGAAGVLLSPGAKIGYFSQQFERTLNMDQTALANALRDSDFPESMARTVLYNLMLDEDDVFKHVSVLSGGERVKVELARLLLGNYNMLILDEPTNHLDIYALEALERLLSAYAGTLLLVSHDERLINGVAQRLLIIENGNLTAFEGTLSEYRARKSAGDRDAQAQRALDADKLRMRMAEIDAQLLEKGISGARKAALESEYFNLAAMLREK